MALLAALMEERFPGVLLKPVPPNDDDEESDHDPAQ